MQFRKDLAVLGDKDTLSAAAVAYVITKNIMRRNLTPDQRAMIAAELYAKLPKQTHGGDRKSSSWNRELEKAPTASSQKTAVAKQVGVSVNKVERAAALQKKDVSKAQQVKAGIKTMAQAEQECLDRVIKSPMTIGPVSDADLKDFSRVCGTRVPWPGRGTQHAFDEVEAIYADADYESFENSRSARTSL